jgi:hypothetical protein
MANTGDSFFDDWRQLAAIIGNYWQLAAVIDD